MTSKKVNMSARRKQLTIDELIDICYQRGIDSATLRPHVEKAVVGGYLVSDNASALWYDRYAAFATEISDGGLTAQLNHLHEVWGLKKLRAELMKLGGVLDAIAKSSGSTPAEIKADTGRHNVDANGELL